VRGAEYLERGPDLHGVKIDFALPRLPSLFAFVPGVADISCDDTRRAWGNRKIQVVEHFASLRSEKTLNLWGSLKAGQRTNSQSNT